MRQTLHEWCLENAGRGEQVYNAFMSKFEDNAYEGNTIDNLTPGSKKKVHFVCENGHEFDMRLDAVKAGQWCPECSKNNMDRIVKKRINTVLNSSISLLEWCNNNIQGKKIYDALMKYSNEKGIKIELDKITYASNQKLGLICEQGHIFYMEPYRLVRGQWCPQCYNLNRTNSNLVKIKGRESLYDWCCSNTEFGNEVLEAFMRCIELNNELGIDVHTITPGSNKRAYFKCDKGHEVQLKQISQVTRRGSICTLCGNNKKSKNYKKEKLCQEQEHL